VLVATAEGRGHSVALNVQDQDRRFGSMLFALKFFRLNAFQRARTAFQIMFAFMYINHLIVTL
jgi:hypothetical protein